MVDLKFSKVEEIFSSREDAIRKLDSLKVPYSTGVVIRYIVKECVKMSGDLMVEHMRLTEDVVYIILAVWKSGERGDYVIISETSTKEPKKEIPFRVFTGVIKEGNCKKETIAAALFGETPNECDLLVLSDPKEGTTESYIFWKGKWKSLGTSSVKDDSKETLETKDSDTISLNLEEGITKGSKVLEAILKYSPEQFRVTEEGLGIKVIYGGTF